jgi:L-cysteine:1D-myo-inositol 2-amino-2-deoxy-alpha-D-glucopyranoside ligase
VNIWPELEVPRTQRPLPKLKLAYTSGNADLDVQSDHFKLYVCGITPYDATHLGHAATYLTFDLINRYLQLAGTSVKFVENITDIDDPLFERAKRDNQSWAQLGESQVALFTSDMTALRILPPANYVAVTEAMDSIIFAIENLVDQNFTYELAGNIYFRIEPFLDELTISIEEALKIFGERGGDPKLPGKENALDPILWVGNKDGEPGWDSKMGFGRPGWHIECSVIALENLIGKDYLNSASRLSYGIDLQGGGSDLIFPHHFMSAAIAKALCGFDFAKGYLHAGMVGLDGEKMSKSKGNLVLISELLKSGYDPMVIRHALLSQGYAEDRMWHLETLLKSQERVMKLRSALARIEVAPTDKVMDSVAQHIANNLDSPSALEVLDQWALDTENGAIGGSVGELSRFIDAALGLAL